MELFLRMDRERSVLVHYFARRVPRELAEDMACQTICTALGKIESYDPDKGDLAPWLQGIAQNVLHRHHRDTTRGIRAVERLGSLASNDDTAHDFADEVVERVYWQSQAERIDEILEPLSRTQRAVLMLRFGYDMDYVPLAEILRIKASTARSYVRRAKLILTGSPS